MSHRIRTSRGAIFVLLAAIAGAHAARAVVVTNPVAPHVYAVSYINEEWTQAPANGGLSGFFDNKEQLEGTDAITSSQKAGTDAIPNPSCTPPCTASSAPSNCSRRNRQ